MLCVLALVRWMSIPHLVIRTWVGCRMLGFLYYYGLVYAVKDRLCLHMLILVRYAYLFMCMH